MAKRSSTKRTAGSQRATKPSSTRSSAPARSSSASSAVEGQVLAFAEQLGYVAGSIQSKAGGVVDREALSRQVAGVRDGAKSLLAQLAKEVRTRVGRTPPPKPPRKARSGGAVDAPGKKHRGPAPAGPPASAERARNARVSAAAPRARAAGHRPRQG